MWLQAADRRPQDDLKLGVSTALVAGLVNVCSAMTFFAFSSNVTGHAATFSEEMVKGNWHQVGVVLVWMLTFALGAFVANACITIGAPRHALLRHGAPLFVQMLALSAVGFYGHQHYLETLWETEVLVGVLLFTMGLQNGTVASVSNSVVRTTHLTGLFTDLAMGLSMILQPRFRESSQLRFRLKLHGAILTGYILGGVLGGVACALIGLRALYFGAGILALILLHDVLAYCSSRRAARAQRAASSEQQGRRFEAPAPPLPATWKR